MLLAPFSDEKLTLELSSNMIISDKIKLTRNTPTEVASHFFGKRTPSVHLQFRFLPKNERFRSNSVACEVISYPDPTL